MVHEDPPRKATLRIPTSLVIGFLMVGAAAGAALGQVMPAAEPSAAESPVDLPRNEDAAVAGEAVVAVPGGTIVGREQRGVLGEAEGAIPAGTTVFDEEVPGVANLNADLIGALRRAAADAANEGIELFVDSGWRSPAYQQRLLDEAVTAYGSVDAAARWVASPNSSAHVSGNAVDIGHSDATEWLSVHGAAYGLCQIYGNEPWHYELRREAIDHGCPPMYTDPTHDPRMQQ